MLRFKTACPKTFLAIQNCLSPKRFPKTFRLSIGFDQQFLFADIQGTRNGTFSELNEGELVGNFGGIDLFISYSAGDGNDIALFSAVPEPSTAGLLSLAMMLAMTLRRRTDVFR